MGNETNRPGPNLSDYHWPKCDCGGARPPDGEGLPEGYEWKRNVYDHGGSRIWIEGPGGERDLIADTYSSGYAEIVWNAVRAAPLPPKGDDHDQP